MTSDGNGVAGRTGPPPGVDASPRTGGPAARAALLEAVFGRMHHELATPLLTAAGFARIAAEDAPPSGSEALERTASGIVRARAVLAAAAAFVASPTVAAVDVTALLGEEVEARTGDRARLDGPPDAGGPTTCHGDLAVVRELLGLTVDVLLARSPDGRVRVRTEPSSATTTVVALDAGGEAWSPEALAAVAAVDVAAPAADRVDGSDEPTRLARVAALVASQLGALWLDPEHGGRLTLRLLAGPVAHEVDDGGDGP